MEVAIPSLLSVVLPALPNRPVLAQDLSPHTVIRVYETEEEKKAGLATWKLLLLGSNTEQSLDLSEVFFDFVFSQLITLFS